LLSALIAGDKRNLDRRLKADYSKTGVAHILAVSGLHMGFVLVIANLLFGWTVLLRYGHVAKNVLVISALWFYAVMAGLSPSAVRAALMLSAAQLALACSVPGNGYNVVLGAATLMLAANPFYLYDLSFQLSFMAVLFLSATVSQKTMPQPDRRCGVQFGVARRGGADRDASAGRLEFREYTYNFADH
jgi:competence protein ComEC